jgi:PIN domain nuclease of toxin-antitoxin system
MKYLLDTHALLWFLMESEALSPRVKALIADPKIDVYASTISFWEISIKHALGKLELTGLEPEGLQDILLDARIGIIGLNEHESSTYGCLPMRKDHKDPFDRMLVWQAITRGMALISRDEHITHYRENGLRVIW